MSLLCTTGRLGPPPPDRTGHGDKRKKQRRRQLGPVGALWVLRLLLLLLVLVVIARPVVGLIVLVAAAIIILTGWLVVRTTGDLPGATVAVILVLGVGVYGVVSALVSPQPLAAVTLATDNTGIVTGRLIAVTDGAWYLGTGCDRFRQVSVRHIEWSRAKSETRRDERPITDKWIWELF
jgi:hypothetical protein